MSSSPSISSSVETCTSDFYMVFGIELMWLGASVHLNLYPISLLASKLVPAVLSIAGVLIFFMAVFGFAAVWKESSTMMKVFLILMILVCLVEVAVEVFTYVFRSQVYNNITGGFEKSIHGYARSVHGYEKSKLEVLIDQLQIKFLCCGSNNYTDWFKTIFGQATLSVPVSCCINMTDSCGRDVSYQTANIHTMGCTRILTAWMEECFSIIRGTGVGFTFAQVIGIFTSYLYIKKLQDNYVPGY
ncbi:CD63 antigen-like isoform X2 [Chiloscyllium plagiosum]|uniref:CD63 antigen-like isoform X2 n=1 Tax=Chiloscyllium plagiosum TaxID=36176 RepID=UPI001CB85294|nr:CD63 antigen-like isoform X2 [Chiloscyllium plagiosum]